MDSKIMQFRAELKDDIAKKKQGGYYKMGVWFAVCYISTYCRYAKINALRVYCPFHIVTCHATFSLLPYMTLIMLSASKHLLYARLALQVIAFQKQSIKE